MFVCLQLAEKVADFSFSADVRDRALALYVNSQVCAVDGSKRNALSQGLLRIAYTCAGTRRHVYTPCTLLYACPSAGSMCPVWADNAPTSLCGACTQLFKLAMSSFRKLLHAGMTRPLAGTLLALKRQSLRDALFPLFAQHAVQKYTPQIQAYRCAPIARQDAYRGFA